VRDHASSPIVTDKAGSTV